MNKLNLGDDFTPEEGSEGAEGEKETIVEKEGEESEEDPEEGSEEPEAGAEDEEEPEAESEKEKPQSKEEELQGLLDAENALDADLTDIDKKIAAARTRLHNKRKARREGRDLVETVAVNLPDGEEEEEVDDLSDIDADTLKVLERFTKAKGLVPKSEIGKMNYQNAHKASEENFYQAHPEYLPENDPDDVLYQALKKELSYFAAPKDPKLIAELFERAHKAVLESHADKFKRTQKKIVTPDVKKGSAIVKKQGIGGGQGGGGGKGKSQDEGKGGKQLSDKQIQALRDGGWTDAEIKELK